MCYHEGDKYHKGQHFTSKDCSKKCTCFGFDDVGCVAACPAILVKSCQHDEVQEMEQISQAENPKCHCRYPTCIKASKFQ